MKIIPVKSSLEGGSVAAKIIIDLINKKPAAVLGLATGSSPETTYSELVRSYRSGVVSFREVRTVNLDEYVGLSGNDEESYSRFMWENLFSMVNIDSKNTNIPNGKAADLDEECERYSSLLRAISPIDIQLLGIGHNGHIGFNEPSDELIERTHRVSLSPSTIEANSRFFDSKSDVPTEAITMGMGEILSAKRIILLAFGEGKSQALSQALTGKITPHCPASYLQGHSDFTVIADEAALSKISENL